jgi:hypothetical protein
MEVKDLTSDELYELYKAKLREENGGTSMAVYSMFLDCGRMGDLTGTFLSSEEEIMEAGGKRVYFGEVLGKHSEIYVDDFDELEVDLVTDDPDAVKIFRDYSLTSGYNPFDYISEDE